MADKIVFFIVYIAEALIAYIYFNDNYKIKRTPLTSILVAFGLYILGFCMNIIFSNNVVVNIIAFFIINLLYSKISFDISLKSAILHSSIILAIMSLTELIIETGVSLLLDIPIDAYMHSFASLVVLGIVEKVLYLIICKFISTAFSYKKNNTPNNLKRDFALFLYPLITTVMLLVYSYTSAVYQFSDTINLVFVAVSIISLVFCCLIFIINQKIQIQEKELIELQSEKQKDEINQSFYELLEKKNEEQHILVHDMKHHYSSLRAMNNIEEVRQYLSTVQPEIIEYKYIGKSKNKMLDLILSKYYHICDINNIKFTADVKSCNLSFVNNNDLTSMLGNLLDNAVEAAKGVANAKIRFAARAESSFYVLTIVNSSSHPPKAQGERLFTTKPDTLFHGHGVKSVERTAKKYDGICEWHYEKSDKTFHFNIIFNKNKGINIKP